MLVTSFIAQIRGIGIMKGTFLINVFLYGPFDVRDSQRFIGLCH